MGPKIYQFIYVMFLLANFRIVLRLLQVALTPLFTFSRSALHLKALRVNLYGTFSQMKYCYDDCSINFLQQKCNWTFTSSLCQLSLFCSFLLLLRAQNSSRILSIIEHIAILIRHSFMTQFQVKGGRLMKVITKLSWPTSKKLP